LCPPLSPSSASEIARAALADTLDAVAGCSADVKIVALAGRPGPWVPAGFQVVPQVHGTLDRRLAYAWAATRELSGACGIQVGMDTPQVTAGELDALIETLVSSPVPGALLGPAADGGWWVIGLRGADPHRVFRHVPMSTPRTGAFQLNRLRALGLRPRVVDTRRDIDTISDLRAVAAAHPRTRTATAWRRWLSSTEAQAS
jgi:hypothetical protein